MSRALKVLVPISGGLAAGSIVWMLVGQPQQTEAGAPIAAPQFSGAERAFLPDDPALGFVDIRGTAPTVPGDSQLAYAAGVPAFSIGKYEVTVAQYRACVDEGGCRPTDPRALDGADNVPVRYVTWLDALDYCRWLERKIDSLAPQLLIDGNRVTLPSEAEFEHAAGGPMRMYPWDGPLTPQRANYANSGHLSPVGVGEHAAGASLDGVLDLSGNVAEWTRSEYRPYPYDPIDGREQMTTHTNPRAIRGGSFYDSTSLLRVSARQAADPNRGYDFVGFRVALSSVPPPPAASGATAGATAK